MAHIEFLFLKKYLDLRRTTMSFIKAISFLRKIVLSQDTPWAFLLNQKLFVKKYLDSKRDRTLFSLSFFALICKLRSFWKKYLELKRVSIPCYINKNFFKKYLCPREDSLTLNTKFLEILYILIFWEFSKSLKFHKNSWQ